MKKILFALMAAVSLLLPIAPRAQAASEVSINFFYDNLSSQGNWIDVADYGYCFQPNVGADNPNWRPYTDGYWAYTEDGWTWVSYEDFGWATYHYGRWTRLTDYGLIWVPGDEWAPAWVSWRTGGDYVGWAPLPPSANRVYEGRAITGHVDIDFDIGPRCYNFVDLRYFGEPVLRSRIIEPGRNVTIINNTVNVTNIMYRDSRVYNYGPDYNRMNRYSMRPIQRLSIERENNIDANTRANGHNFTRVNGKHLMVVAPTIQKSDEKFIPKNVKAKVQQPKFEHGWQGISNRQQLQAEMRKENRKNIPPPNFLPEEGRKAETARQNPPPAQRPNEKPAATQQGQGKKEPERKKKEDKEKPDRP